MGSPLSMKPFVSCICVTKDRQIFLRQAIRYFERAYDAYVKVGGESELVIVDSSALSIPMPGWISYLHVPMAETRIGHLRNLACNAARGDIVLHWDDDDWHSSERIVRQVAAIEALDSGFTYSSSVYWYDVSRRLAGRCPSWGRGGTIGTLFAYHRNLWQRTKFRDLDIGEDSAWWAENDAWGTTFIDSRDPSLSIYIRHNANWSSFSSLASSGEDKYAVRGLFGDDAIFYDELSQILPIRELSKGVSDLQSHLLKEFYK
jgi:glycosyltransferase involved in cell wall biosynthesis